MTARVAALARLRPLNPNGWSKHLVDRRIATLLARGAPTQWVASPSEWSIEYHSLD